MGQDFADFLTAGCGLRHACVQKAATNSAVSVEGCEEYTALVLEGLVDAAGGKAHGFGKFADRRGMIAALGKHLQRLVERCVAIEFARSAAHPGRFNKGRSGHG